MKGKSPDGQQDDLFRQRLDNMINLGHPLCRLAVRIPWADIDAYFDGYYSENGRAANPVRLMVGLLILKQMYNLSDESVVEKWVENPYYQYFCGEVYFQWEMPTHPTDLVHFRHRIGEDGAARIFQISIDLHGKKAREKEVLIDTTVQEKNITFPTDIKLYRKITEQCVKIAQKTGDALRKAESPAKVPQTGRHRANYRTLEIRPPARQEFSERQHRRQPESDAGRSRIQLQKVDAASPTFLFVFCGGLLAKNK